MPTSCQTIVDGAKAFNGLNAPLVSDPVEMLKRIRADQQALFSENAGVTRDRFQKAAILSSSSGGSGRAFALDDASMLAVALPPVERVLVLDLGVLGEASQVDVQDLTAEYPPRYIVRDRNLIEVSSDWGTAGPVAGTLIYVYGPTKIDPAGLLTQLVSVPDEWTDLLVLPLAKYLFQKDPGRDPAEGVRLDNDLAARQTAFLDYLTNYGGVEVKRFQLPTPQRSSQKK